uniref:Uncharacterized protein n=1 Tax=Anguilla anguilla TaxID=7936 RepID=A0A0E9WS92_ANGAN
MYNMTVQQFFNLFTGTTHSSKITTIIVQGITSYLLL